jgi:hypothetical protein
MRALSTACLVLASVALSGCFKSDAPLIALLDSQAPVSSGIYTYTEDGATKQAAVSIDWPATVVTTTKTDGSLEVDRYYMRAINDDGYYVVMDARSNYGLIRVEDGQVELYDGGDNCDRLQDLAEAPPEETEFTYDVDISGENPSDCTFKDFTNLAQAYNDLLGARSLTVSRTYVRQQ